MKIAFIGSNGVPNVYGGFESFLESICPILVQEGHQIYVSCDPKHHPLLDADYNGVNKYYVNVRANGPLSTLHDALAFFKALFLAEKIVVLGVSAGPFFPLFRFFCFLFNKKLIVNIDGVEWRRSKFSIPVRTLLFIYDFLAQLSADVIVYDNNALKRYIAKPFRSKSKYVAYSADQVFVLDNINPIRNHCLTICRIEPENNIEMIIRGFLNSKMERYVIVGNWQNSDYGKKIKAKYQGNPRLDLREPTYDHRVLSELRSSCSAYVHGHSVGGTNPSLIEMFPYQCFLICFDCDFNKDSAGDNAIYFSCCDELSLKLNKTFDQILLNKRVVPERFTAKYIANVYAEI